MLLVVTFEIVFSFIMLGVVAGFLAGLIGIGGGAIMVPVLISVFLSRGDSVEDVVHLALVTSMACMVVTSFSSFRAHQAKRAVRWDIVKVMAIGTALGSYLFAIIASSFNSLFLTVFFVAFMLFVCKQMFFGVTLKANAELPKKTILFAVGLLIGSISSLVSIGGGSLTVPYLTRHKVDIKHAIGTSSAIAFPIAVAGTAGYLTLGLLNNSSNGWVVGHVDLIAVLFVSCAGYLMAPVGVACAHRMPAPMLKKLFSVLLLLLSIKMLYTVGTNSTL